MAPAKLVQNWIRPSPENAVQTLVSSVSDPKFYSKEFSGKVLYRHSADKWDQFVEKNNQNRENAKPSYFGVISQPKQLEMLNQVATEWTNLEQRKAEVLSSRQMEQTDSRQIDQTDDIASDKNHENVVDVNNSNVIPVQAA